MSSEPSAASLVEASAETAVDLAASSAPSLVSKEESTDALRTASLDRSPETDAA